MRRKVKVWKENERRRRVIRGDTTEYRERQRERMRGSKTRMIINRRIS